MRRHDRLPNRAHPPHANRRGRRWGRCWLWFLFAGMVLAGCGITAPSAGQVPTSVPVPAPPPYPTMEPRRWLGGSDPHATVQLPGTALDVHLAVHPTQGWPAVAILQRFAEGADPIQAFVRVLNPHTGQWSAAQQVDIGESSNGMDRFGSALVGITGDGVVHAVWGGSDAPPSDPSSGGIWTSASADYGVTWSAPARLLTHCWSALDMATTPSGQIVVLANCWTLVHDDAQPHAEIRVRDAHGQWLPPERIAVDARSGALALAGDGPDLRITALTLPLTDGQRTTAHLLGKYLRDPGPWQVHALPLPSSRADQDVVRWQVRHLSFTRVLPDQRVTTGLIFTWSDAERAHAYALTSLDGGLTVGAVSPIVVADPAPAGRAPTAVFAAPAYDPVADRLVAIWSCCHDASAQPVPATHYASWSVPGSDRWTMLAGRGPVPGILGARAAHRTATAQAPMSRWTWLAWIEGSNTVLVRSVDLNTLIPVGQYPTPTPGS